MAYSRSFKRPKVDDPVIAKALQQIDEEIGKLLSYINSKATKITIGETEPANPEIGDIWIDTTET